MVVRPRILPARRKQRGFIIDPFQFGGGGGGGPTDPDFASVVLLCHLDAYSSGSTYASVVVPTGDIGDLVGSGNLTTAQPKFGLRSFAGNGASLAGGNTSNKSEYAYGTADWCIEHWLRMNDVTTTQVILDQRQTSTEPWVAPSLFIASGAMNFYTNGGTRITGGSLSINTYYHIALARVGGTTRLFVDGTQVGSSYADSNNYVACPLYLMTSSFNTAYTNGYMDEIRITNGAGRYSSNFTAPTAAFPDS